MSFGRLSQLFACFAWKQLSAVEVDPEVSNGHEFNASRVLRGILGQAPRKTKDGNGIPTRFVYLSDDDEDLLEDEGNMSWYDSRQNHVTRTEWRLYYTDNAVIGREGRARKGDLLVIAFVNEVDSATVFVAPSGSTSENQLRWLFGIAAEPNPSFRTAVVADSQTVDMTRARILEAAGVEIAVRDDSLLDRMIELFDGKFPSAATFGDFIRKEVSDVKAHDGPDKAIMSWMENEEYAFRVLERHIVNRRLEAKFEDVEDFVRYSLSVQNRRKARAGLAFENHLTEIFRANQLSFEVGVTLESKAKPDFLFPSKDRYFDERFPREFLTLLGAKTSCKDRWRQVLAEGVRVMEKHLVTLQPSISTDQLQQMRSHRLQLIVPESVKCSYSPSERPHLWNLERFIDMVRTKEATALVHYRP